MHKKPQMHQETADREGRWVELAAMKMQYMKNCRRPSAIRSDSQISFNLLSTFSFAWQNLSSMNDTKHSLQYKHRNSIKDISVSFPSHQCTDKHLCLRELNDAISSSYDDEYGGSHEQRMQRLPGVSAMFLGSSLSDSLSDTNPKDDSDSQEKTKTQELKCQPENLEFLACGCHLFDWYHCTTTRRG